MNEGMDPLHTDVIIAFLHYPVCNSKYSITHQYVIYYVPTIKNKKLKKHPIYVCIYNFEIVVQHKITSFTMFV